VDTVPAPRQLRADAKRNRVRVLEAARAVFAERGLSATLDHVAVEAGVGVATVYRRFGSKEELIEALFADELDHLVEQAEAALAVDDPWEGFVQMLAGMSEVLVQDQGIRDVLMHDGLGQTRVAAARSRFLPAAEAVVVRAQASGQLRPDVTAVELPVLLLMVETAGALTRAEDPDQWRRYLGVLLEGLQARTPAVPLPGPPPLSVERVSSAIDQARYPGPVRPRASRAQIRSTQPPSTFNV
jgi:AcrR family transcriptional regulator